MALDLTLIRDQFPALVCQAEQSSPAVFFDNPGGTQIARASLERMTDYLVRHNANHGGAFATSQQSDAVLAEAHAAMADFYNAARPEEIIFGNNMTTLTLHISRSIARAWNPGDEIVVTRLDHDANITPWVLAAEDRGCKVRWVDFDVEDGTLDLDDMRKALQGRPRLVAFGYASNALGTINPAAEIVRMAHEAGALVYVDAVQYAAHGPIDVQALDCDFLVSSSYKFFGPHAGILYGKYDLLNALFAYKVRPAADQLPDRFETGTQNHEGLAGVLGAVEYFEWLGRTFGEAPTGAGGRKQALQNAMRVVRSYETELSRAILQTLQEIPGLRLYGPADPQQLDKRVPTFSFTLEGWAPRQLAEALAKRGIYVWDGNYYALAITERLGVEESGGMLRVGAVHYNTLAEVETLKKALWELSKGSG